MAEARRKPRAARRWVRPVVDYGPLVAFLGVYWGYGLLAATAALIAATAVALGLAFFLERRLPPAPLVTAALALVFGGLTLWFGDERFIKLKPTVMQLLFAAVLLGGLGAGRPLLKPLLQAAWQLDERGWRLLTLRFGLFFLAMAGLNEIVWRTQPTEIWVTFKVFGIVGLTFLFTAAQIPLVERHRLRDKGERKRSR